MMAIEIKEIVPSIQARSMAIIASGVSWGFMGMKFLN